MPLTNAPAAPEQDDFPKLADYIGRIVVLAPQKTRTVTTTYGEKTVTDALCWCLTERKSKLDEVGQASVFGDALRTQIGESEPGHFVAGRLMLGGRNGKRQELGALDEETLKLVDKLLTSF